MMRNFTKELSNIQIPNLVEEATQDQMWVEAMETEM
jgi:hypothetical protein